MKTLNKNYVFPLSVVILLLLWIAGSTLNIINPLFFPEIQDFFVAGQKMFAEKWFMTDIGISIFRVVTAFLLSFVIAVPLALLMSSWKKLFNLVTPYLDFIRYLPVPALIPLTILFFGIGEWAKISLLFIGTFFQLILLILDNLQHIPKEYLDLAYILKFSKYELFKTKLRSIWPQLFNNSRITIWLCWTYLVIAELVAANSGIWHVIKEAQRFSNIPDLYVGIAVIGIIWFFSDYIFRRLYPHVFKYKINHHDWN